MLIKVNKINETNGNNDFDFNDITNKLKEKLKAKAKEFNFDINQKYEIKSNSNKYSKRKIKKRKILSNEVKEIIRQRKEEEKLKKIKITKEKTKIIFECIKKEGGRKIYSTYLLGKINKAEVNKNCPSRFYALFSVVNQEGPRYLNLYKVKKSDEFLGIYYGFEKLEEPMFYKKSEIKYANYLEVRFKKGSVIIRLNVLHFLIKLDKLNDNYELFKNDILNFEKEVYKFYNKKLNKSPLLGYIEKERKLNKNNKENRTVSIK